MKDNKDIYSRVKEFIVKYSLVERGERILLSMSAGKDSIILFDVFMHIRDEFDLQLGIFHLNHMMRGKESDADEKLVIDMARRENIKLFSYQFDFKKNKQPGTSFEEYARNKRYELINSICRDNDFHKVATAHNYDDNVETIAMRIFSGTGIHGLSGIDIKRGNIIRPLLFLSSEEIYSHLKKNKIQWREDLSNKDEFYLRNFVRNNLLPVINSRFENYDKAITSLSQIASDYESIITELLSERGELFKIENNSVIIDSDLFLKNEKLFRYVVSKAIRDNFGEFVTSDILNEIYKKASVNRSHVLLYQNKSLSVKKTLDKDKKSIIIILKDTGSNDNAEWEYSVDLIQDDKKSVFIKELNTKIYFTFVDFDYYLKNNKLPGIIFISLSEDEKAVIRNRRRGDRIVLEHGSKKIKDLMIDKKLDKETKQSVPLLVIGSRIAAIIPVQERIIPKRVSSEFYVNNDSKKILAIHSDKYQL